MDRVTFISIFLILMVLLLPVFAKLMKRWPKTLKVAKICILAVYLLANIYLTMTSRPTKIYHHMRLTPFWSYRNALAGDTSLGVQIILNILLYVPLGYLLHFAFPKLKVWQVILCGVMLSGLTESIQLFFKLGLCEVDDVINNTLGTVIGIGCYLGMKRIMKDTMS